MSVKDYFGSIDSIIKRDDIRGVYRENIDEDVARNLGQALASYFRRTTAVEPVNVVIGHDMRLSGPALSSALGEGLSDGGCRPIHIGLTGTEQVGFLPAKYSDVIDGGIIITASHNPRKYIGFKMFGRGGQPMTLAKSLPVPEPEDELQRLALALKKQQIPARLKWEDFAPDYVSTALERGGCDFERALEGASDPLRVAVEAGNGMGGPLMREVERQVPQLEWNFSNDRADGSFPVIVPNPLEEEYQNMLRELVHETGSHMGMCLDGDADRVSICDENGDMISPPFVTALIGKRLREKVGSDAKIAHNLACSWAIADTLGDRDKVTQGGATQLTPVGYGKIKVIMHKDPSIAMGAEHSGHYMFREFWCADSGMLTGLLMLEFAAELHSEGKTLSSAVQPLRNRYFESGEINFNLPPEQPGEKVIERAVKEFQDEAVRIFCVTPDGARRVESYPPEGMELAVADCRVEAEDWWFCMRKSGTEAAAGDKLRLYVESCGDASVMEDRRDKLVEMVGPELRA